VDGSALGLALVRKKKGEVSEGSFSQGFIEWCRAVERERVGARPTTDRRRRHRAPSGTLGRVAASAPAAQRGGAVESQQELHEWRAGLARSHVGWRRVARGQRAARETAGGGGVTGASRNRARGAGG
jgi:hypothetical protein